MAERTPGGIRIRDLSANPGEMQTKGVKEIDHAMIERGEVIDLPQTNEKGKRVTFQVRPVLGMKAAFEKSVTGKGKGGALQVYTCSGHWLMGSASLTEKYIAYNHGSPAFTIYKGGSDYRIDFHVEGVRVMSEESSSRPGVIGQALSFSEEKLASITLALGSVTWRFGAVTVPNFVNSAPDAALDEESRWFRKALTASVGLLGLLALVTAIWPASQKTEELIPIQFTKLVMKSQSQPQPKEAQNTPTEQQNTNAPKKAEQTKVAQAFRAKALQNAVSGLLKGGMTTLLAQSDFVSGKNASADAKKMFGSKSDALKAPTGSNMNAPVVAVAAVGGESGPNGAGYRKSQHAEVAGQGKNHVAMDTAGSSVEEGLTKDEVGEVIHRHLSEVRYCYESAMIRTPDIEGKLVMDFMIGGNGLVKASSVKQSTLPDPRLDDCILRRLMTWKFPQTKGGVDVAVSYPFIFKTLGR